MKTKIAYCVIVLSCVMSVFTSCKKDSNDNKIATTVNTTQVSLVTNTSAVVKGSITASGNVAEAGVCYGTTPNPTIAGSVVKANTQSGSFSVTLSALTPGTTYYAKAYATVAGTTTYGEQVSFTTSFISLNYKAFYDLAVNNHYYNDKQLFSVEGARHTIYGHGFTLAPVVVKMMEKGNPANTVTPVVTVVNDSTLSFKVPAELVGQQPYAEAKEYFFTVNDMVFQSYYSFYNNGNYNDTAYLKVANKDINISGVTKMVEAGCNRYILSGSFASGSGTNQHHPVALLGVQAIPVSRRLTVKAGGSLYNYYDLQNGNPTCGVATMQALPYTGSMYMYHEPLQVGFKENLPAGMEITFQVENTMADGTVVKSNVFSYAN